MLLSSFLLLLVSFAVGQNLCPDESLNRNITTAIPIDATVGQTVNITEMVLCSFSSPHFFELQVSNTSYSASIRVTALYNQSSGLIAGSLINYNGSSLTSFSSPTDQGFVLTGIVDNRRCGGQDCYISFEMSIPVPNVSFNNYSLVIESNSCLQDTAEPNDVYTAAAQISLGKFWGQYTLCGLESDWYKLNPKSEQLLTINITSSGLPGDLILEFYNWTGSSVELLKTTNSSRLDYWVGSNTYYLRFFTTAFVKGWGLYSFTLSPAGGYPLTSIESSVTATFPNVTGSTNSPGNFSSNSAQETSDGDRGLDYVSVVVAVVVCVLVFCIALSIIFVIKRKRSQKKHTFRENSGRIRDSLGTEEVTRTFSKKAFDSVPFNELTLEGKIGEGSTGAVYKAKWRETEVAVKQLHNTLTDKQALLDFRTEARLMRGLRSHPNVVLFIGICVPPDPICIITEYLKQGSMSDYLSENQNLEFKTKLKLMLGIAKGMFHLHREGIVHRDLAARNILLTSDLTPKVSDFGMSRQLDVEEKAHTCNRVGPLKWMAPESISSAEYSYKSDAWMFGIVCWEILTSSIPYSHLAPLQAATKVVTESLRLEIPKETPVKLTKLMKACWRFNPKERPSFEIITNKLRRMLHDETGGSDDEVERLEKESSSGERTYSASPVGVKGSGEPSKYYKSPHILNSQLV